MDLGETGVGKQRPLQVGPPDRTRVRFEGVGGEVVDVGVAPTGQHHGIGGVGLELAAEQVAAHHPAGHPSLGHQLQHLAPGEQLHPTRRHLAHQGLVGAIEQLLAGLAAGVEGAAHQGAAEVAVGQGAAIFPGKGHPLGDALVDDRATDFGQAVATGLPGPKVSPLERVGKQALDAVTVVGVVLGGIDTSLGGHRMGPPRAVVEGDQLHLVALLRQAGRRGRSGQAAAHHHDPQLALAQRADQGQPIAAAAPGRGQRPGG